MRFLKFLVITICSSVCNNQIDYLNDPYIQILEEYFYSEYLGINCCYSCWVTKYDNHLDSTYHLIYDQNNFNQVDTGFGFFSQDSMYYYRWIDMISSFESFYDCRSFTMMMKNTYFILLRRNNLIRLNELGELKFNDNIGLPEELIFKGNFAVSKFLGNNFSILEPISNPLESEVISSFKFIDFEHKVLNGESHLNNNINADKTVVIITYDSAIVNEDLDKAALFIQTNTHGTSYLYIYFFEKVATRWNKGFYIKYSLG